MNNLRILIADDHAIVRMGLIALLNTKKGLTVVGEAENGSEAIRKTTELKPDVVVMDLMMPETDGLEATAAIKRTSPRTRVLVLTTSSLAEDLRRALDAGADGIVLKASANAELVRALCEMADGKSYVSGDAAKLLASPNAQSDLTPRQIEVLSAVTRGFTNADIAKQLGISLSAVKAHMTAILAKIGASNRSEAVAITLRDHLVRF